MERLIAEHDNAYRDFKKCLRNRPKPLGMPEIILYSKEPNLKVKLLNMCFRNLRNYRHLDIEFEL